MQKPGFGAHILILSGNQVAFAERVRPVDGTKLAKGVPLCHEEEVAPVDTGTAGKTVVQGKCCQVPVYLKPVAGPLGLLRVLLELEVCQSTGLLRQVVHVGILQTQFQPLSRLPL